MTEQKKKSLDISRLGSRGLMALDACMHCGECKVWCPVVAEDPREQLTPRSKAKALTRIIDDQYGILGDQGPVAGLLGPKVKDKLRAILRYSPPSASEIETFKESLFECSTCGQCAVVCPAGIDTVELWETSRRAMVDAGLGPLDNHQHLVTSILKDDNPWQQPRSGRSKWARKAKRAKEIQAAPTEIKSPGQVPVLYFVGCTASYDANIREVAVNTVNILNAAGVEFGILGNKERCCASIMRRIGMSMFEEYAIQNIEAFNELGIQTLVTSCAGCFKTISSDYPRLGKLNFEVLHITQLITRLIDQGKLVPKIPQDIEVTYHDPCHLGRATRVYDAPRQVLESLPGVRLIEMERTGEYARCCGAGGGLKAGFADVQHKLSNTRVTDAEATGATDFVTACPFCYQSLKEGIVRQESRLRMREITELVVQSIKS